MSPFDRLESLDPLELDRALQRCRASAVKWCARVRNTPDPSDDPFEPHRWAVGRSAFRAVSEQLAPDDPLRAPLQRWVYRLAELRINRAAICQVEISRRLEEHVVDVPEHARLSLAAMLNNALSDGPLRAGWFQSFIRSSRAFASLTDVLWQRRREVASRMGLEEPQELSHPLANDDLQTAALAWCRASDDSFDAHRHERLADHVEAALGLEADTGWPAHITPGNLIAPFSSTDLFRSLDVDPGPFAPAIGAASYLRGLRRLGAAWADAAAPRDQPFVIAHDAYGLRRLSTGALFALLPLSRPFAQRELGLSGDALERHLRALARVVLLESRALAMRAALLGAAYEGGSVLRESFEQEAARYLGLDLPPALAGAVFRNRVDDGQRFVALFLAADRAHRLTEVHDEDWYRNPRAAEQLRAEAALSPEWTTNESAVERGARRLIDALSSLRD